MISYAGIQNCLRPYLGSRMLPYLDENCGTVITRLTAFGPKDDPGALSDWMSAYLYDAVRRVTRGAMQAGLDDGRIVSLRVEDFSQMADDILYCLFSGFPRDAQHLIILRDYSLRHRSLSALRALYCDFRTLISDEESTIILKVILGYPPRRYAQWLKLPSPGGEELG